MPTAEEERKQKVEAYVIVMLLKSLQQILYRAGNLAFAADIGDGTTIPSVSNQW